MLSEAEQRSAHELAQTRAELADAQRRAAALEARQAPRRLTSEQAQAVKGGLKERPETPVVVSDMLGDPESEQYANELTIAIRQAGWQVDVRHSKFEPQPRGLIVQVRNLEAAPRAAGILLDALRRAGLEVQVAQNQGVAEALTILIVGHKPEPSADIRTAK